MIADRPVADEQCAASSALLVGIGNSGRQDDGLGWAFLDRIEQDALFDGRIEYRYQLQVEDAALVRDAARIVFVDACLQEQAVLIFLDNIYMYGPAPLSIPFDEEHPQDPDHPHLLPEDEDRAIDLRQV